MAQKANYFFPECYVDTNIMKTLLHLDRVNHQHGCPNVMNGMKSDRFADGFAVGVIDDDKKKTFDYRDFELLCKSDHLKLLKHRTRHHYLIFVYKAAEDFLLSCASEIGVKLSDFSLPETMEELKDVTKDNQMADEPRIRRLVYTLRDASEMARLERILKYLNEKQYAVNIEEVIELFRM